MGGDDKRVGQLVVGQPCSVGDARFELATSSVSGKRATAAPIALTKQLFCCEVRTGFEPAYTALQAAA